MVKWLIFFTNLIITPLTEVSCMKQSVGYIFNKGSKAPINLSTSQQADYLDKKNFVKSSMLKFDHYTEHIKRYTEIKEIQSKINGKPHGGLLSNLNENESITYQCTSSPKIIATGNGGIYPEPFLNISDQNKLIKPSPKYLTKSIFVNKNNIKTHEISEFSNFSGNGVVLDWDRNSTFRAAWVEMSLNNGGEFYEQTPGGLYLHKTTAPTGLINFILNQKNPKSIIAENLFNVQKIMGGLRTQDLTDIELTSFFYTNNVYLQNKYHHVNKITIKNATKGILIEKELYLDEAWLNSFLK